MKRSFRFDDGTGARFWAIRVDGASLTTRFGALGTAGRTRTKTYGTANEADGELDRTVASRLALGYEPTDPAGPTQSIEAALARDPDDLEALLVWADALQAHGDPLGERIALAMPGAAPAGVQLEWVRGLIRSMTFPAVGPEDAAALRALLAQPAARLCQSLRCEGRGEEGDGRRVIDAVIARSPRPSALRSLVVHRWAEGADIGPLPSVTPHLRVLELPVGRTRASCRAWPSLERLVIGVHGDNAAELGAMALPGLTDLELRYVGHLPKPNLLFPLLTGRIAPGLRRIRLVGNAAFTDPLASVVRRSRIATQVDLTTDALQDWDEPDEADADDRYDGIRE